MAGSGQTPKTEARETAQGPYGSVERERRMRGRNRALLAVLVALVSLFYVIAFVRMGAGQ
ncbi:MAG: hypothetical protein RIC93_00955 [Alphaproteobacteria bacterium]